jgi:hypothetical protein
MNKQKLEITMRKELENLNNQIDEKIIKGLSYSKEAKRHKFILARLSEIRRQSNTGWFSRSLSFVSSITL